VSCIKSIKKGLSGCIVVLGAGFSIVGPANAATTTYTVTSTNSDNGGGVCAGTTCPTLRSALTAANALAASSGDDISVVFDAAVSGVITYNNGNQRMLGGGIPGAINNPSIYGNGGNEGAVFLIKANRPLTLDLGNRVSLEVASDGIVTAQLYVASDNATVKNFNTGRGINSAGTGIVIGNVQNTLISNGLTQTLLVPYQALDFCMALLDGASNVSVTDYVCDGGNLSGLVVNSSNTATTLGVSNVTLDKVTFKNTNGGASGGDIRIAAENPAYPGAYTTVTNMNVRNSSFSSAATAVDNSIIFRGGSIIDGFTVENSTFTGAGTRAIYVEDSTSLGFGNTHLVNTINLTIKNNTFTGTAEMIRLYALAAVNNNNTYATHTGLTITGNTIDGASCSTNPCGLVHLSGDPGKTVYNNTLIENNQFLNQGVGTNACGLYIHSGGTNNIVRNNTLDGDTTHATAKSIHAIYSDALGNPTANQSGWTFATNDILNYNDGQGPILLNSTTNTTVYGNTFGIGTLGAAAGDTTPESAGSMFVTNTSGSSANFNIQTWRPTVAYYGPQKVIVTVAPVNPVVGGNSLNEPQAPVYIDVYYTATDKAEKYLGRIAGTHAAADGPVTFTFPNANVGAGAVRVQVTETGAPTTLRSSQYSASVTMLPLTDIEARGRSGGGAMGGWVLAVLSGLALLRRRSFMVPLLGLMGLVAATNANAADSNNWASPIYGGIKAGGLVTDFDADKLRDRLVNSGTAASLTEVQKKSSHLGYGAWLGYALTENLGLELSYTGGADERVRLNGYVPSLKAALDAGKPELIGYGASYLASLRFQKELSQNWFVSPRVGVGMTRTHQTLESLDTGDTATFNDKHFSYNVGAGIHYVLSQNWSLGLLGDFYQVPRYGSYGMVSLALEWHVPSAFRSRREVPAPLAAVVAPAAVAALVVVPPPVVPTPVPVVVPPPPPAPERIELKGVNFNYNSNVLTPESRVILSGVAKTLAPRMQASPELQVEVSGHTDSIGNEASNRRLSQARAQAVADYLVASKIDGARLHIIGLGSSQPVASNETEEGRSQNRRVELKLGK